MVANFQRRRCMYGATTYGDCMVANFQTNSAGSMRKGIRTIKVYHKNSIELFAADGGQRLYTCFGYLRDIRFEITDAKPKRIQTTFSRLT